MASHLNRLDQAVSDLKGVVFNVKDFGAVGNGATDDAAAIRLAYTASRGTSGGRLHFPSGNYVINSALSFTGAQQLEITADSNAYITVGFASGDAITVNGPGFFSIHGLTLTTTATRVAGSYFLKVTAPNASIYDVQIIGTGAGGGFWLSGCNSPRMSRCSATNLAGAALRMSTTGGAAIDNVFMGDGTTANEPAVWITGTCTSNTFTNCHFGGGGYAASYAISGITSTAGNFTITTSGTHTFTANDFVVIRNSNVAAYNSMWRVASVTATTIVVTSTLNPGVASATGTAETITSCFYVDDSLGSVNESMISNCIFEAATSTVYGTAGAYFNGRAATGNTITGWTITGCYFDYGSHGIILTGQDANPSHQPTTYGFTISNHVFSNKMRAIHLDRVQGITVDNCSTTQASNSADGVSATCGLYVWAGSDAQTRGITVRGNNFGWGRDFGYFGETLLDYGVILDGAGINDLIIEGNQIAGNTAAFQMVNTPVAAAQRWKIEGNHLASGSLPIANSTFLPSVSSAATIDLTALPFDTIKITGTTNIGTISGGWIGRKVTLMFTGALSLITGGNFAFSANRTILAGDMAVIEFDGTSWYVR